MLENRNFDQKKGLRWKASFGFYFCRRKLVLRHTGASLPGETAASYGNPPVGVSKPQAGRALGADGLLPGAGLFRGACLPAAASGSLPPPRPCLPTSLSPREAGV